MRAAGSINKKPLKDNKHEFVRADLLKLANQVFVQPDGALPISVY